MPLSIEVIDQKNLEDSKWLLCKCNLWEYLEQLKPTFYEYIVQRKIVKNKYLNTLVNTILNNEPIPVITLTTTSKIPKDENDKEVYIDMLTVEILDGLQRTFRLWAYYKVITERKRYSDLSAIEFAKKLKEEFPEFFDSGILTLTILKDYISKNRLETIEKAFQGFKIYFFLWCGLSTKKVIHKMLILNAGQRPVSLAHQYELLFLYIWEEAKLPGINLYRERDPLAIKIKAGERKAGDYMFSSVIAGLRSYLENKPKIISIDDLDIEDLQQEQDGSQINESVFSKPYIEKFLSNLKQADEIVIEKENEDGRKWFVRDTTLSGMLAGLGKHVEVKDTMPLNEIDILTTKAFTDLFEKINIHGFALQDFQKEYYNLQSRSVNVGTYVRSIIMDYTFNLLRGLDPNWEILFSKSKSKT